MFVRTTLATAAALTCMPITAEASEKKYFFGTAVSSALLDRGEQIGGETLEVVAGVEADFKAIAVYGSVYRLQPIGENDHAYDTEMDYTIGVIWEGNSYVADVAANWLTYPGEAADSSLEMTGVVTFDAPLQPGIAGFYDVNTEDWGMEVFAGPEWPVGQWSLYALARVGFVDLGDGSEVRSYGGAEIGAARAILQDVELGIYVRAEASDSDSFVDQISPEGATGFRREGLAAGISLSIAG